MYSFLTETIEKYSIQSLLIRGPRKMV